MMLLVMFDIKFEPSRGVLWNFQTQIVSWGLCWVSSPLKSPLSPKYSVCKQKLFKKMIVTQNVYNKD